MTDFKGLIDIAIDKKLNNAMFSNIVYAELVSLEPLNFKPKDNPKIDIKEEFLVVPKYRVFTTDDLNKNFVLISNNGGQTFFYLYQASEPQGSNGLPHSFEGDHLFEDGEVTCELHGTCSCGSTTVVTHGSIKSYKGKISKITEDNHINSGGGK